MKYAKEVIDLLAAYPGREFRMIQIVRHVGDGTPRTPTERDRLRKGIRRVIDSLEEQGVVVRVTEAAARGCHHAYTWKVGHGALGKWDAKCDNTGRTIAS